MSNLCEPAQKALPMKVFFAEILIEAESYDWFNVYFEYDQLKMTNLTLSMTH